jgi:acetoin utilization deacetylase AcuC-like enzyme
MLVSAGFDAHRADPLAEMALTAGDFARLATTVAALSPPDRLLLHLEGGYDLRALRSSVAATLGALLGSGTTDEPPTTGGAGRDQVDEIVGRRRAALDAMG